MTINQSASPIKIVKLINGDDVVCVLPKKQLGEKSPLLRLEKPLQIKYVPQLTPQGIKDYVALIKWAAYTPDEIITIPKDKIMSISNASNDMTKSYFKVIKDYSKPEKVIEDEQYERKRFSDKQNKEINEIFDENDDEDNYVEYKKTLH
jgi:hypothetical protein